MIARSSATAEIAHVGGHLAVQGHSMSLMLVPIEKKTKIRLLSLKPKTYNFKPISISTALVHRLT